MPIFWRNISKPSKVLIVFFNICWRKYISNIFLAIFAVEPFGLSMWQKCKQIHKSSASGRLVQPLSCMIYDPMCAKDDAICNMKYAISYAILWSYDLWPHVCAKGGYIMPCTLCNAKPTIFCCEFSFILQCNLHWEFKIEDSRWCA